MMSKLKFIATVSAALLVGVVLGGTVIAGAGPHRWGATNSPAVAVTQAPRAASVAATPAAPTHGPAIAVGAPLTASKAAGHQAGAFRTRASNRVYGSSSNGSVPACRTRCLHHSRGSASSGSGSSRGWNGGASRGRGNGGCGW